MKGSIDFHGKYKDFKFSDEVLMKGTFKPKSKLTKLEFQHNIEILSSDLINVRERKVRFHFRLVMRPDVGEMNFDGECILESPQQNKIHFVINSIPKGLLIFMEKIILKESYYHAEKFAKQENFQFPPVQLILKMNRIK